MPLPVGERFTAGDSTFQVRRWPPEVLRTLREQSEPLLALIDASRDKEIWPLLSHSEAHYSCLLAGTRAQSLAAWAPYLVLLPKSSVLLEVLVREGWGKHWGVYLTSLTSFETVLAHLQQWLWVQTEAGKPLYFRFYDPKTLRVWLPTLTVVEQQRFFGPVKRWLVEDGHEGEVLEYVPESGAALRKSLASWEVNKPFIIRQEQMTAFSQAVREQFIIKMAQRLRNTFPDKTSYLEEPTLRVLINNGILKAAQYGIEREREVEGYLHLMLAWSVDFDTHPNMAWAGKILTQSDLKPEVKIAALYKRYASGGTKTDG